MEASKARKQDFFKYFILTLILSSHLWFSHEKPH
jgi:hypothetical protein